MRDLIVLAFTIGSAYIGFVRPWMGVLALAVLNYLNPHRYAWGFATTMPVYFIVFVATVLGLVFNGKDRQPFPWTWETRLFISLLAWFTFTTFWGPDFPVAARQHWDKVMKIYISIFPTLLLITNKERLRWLVIVIALSFGLIGLKGGIFAFGTGFRYHVVGPADTFYGGNNEIALALNMTLPLLMLCAKEVRSKNAKIFFYVVFFFSVCSIISTWSRGGLITLCAVLGAIVLTGRRKWLSIPLVVIAVMVAKPNLPVGWSSRMSTIETYQHELDVKTRFEAWDYAWERAKESPLTGGGFETWMGGPRDVHNAYLEILSEHGFVAFTFWLFLFFGSIIGLERLRRRASTTESNIWMKDYARAIQISLLGYGVGGMALGVAYWDIFYHLVALSVLLKVMLGKAERQVEPVGQLAG
jgi:putative inorganic carbon (HCO3(-)) transporter